MQKQIAITLLMLVTACALTLTAVGSVAADPVRGNPDNPDAWDELETEHFVVYYPAEGDFEAEAQRTAERTEQLYNELVMEVPDDENYYSFSEKMVVYMHPPSDWDRNEQSLVWYDTDPIAINFAAPESSGVTLDGLSSGIAHEIANVLLWDSAGQYDDYNYYQRNPSWFGEGLSEFYVYSTPTVEGIESYDETYGGEQRINEINDGIGTWGTMTGNRYSGGYYLTTYLTDEYGEEAVWQILKDDSETFEQAVQASLGDSYEDVQQGWYEWIENEYGGDYSRFYTESAAQQQLSDAREQIEELESLLEERNQTIADLQGRESQEELLEQRNETVAEQSDRISELEATVEEQEETIEELRSQQTEESGSEGNNENDSTSSADDAGPGFGLGVALIALLTTALSIRSRQA